MNNFGIAEGDICNREKCIGVMGLAPRKESCSCHICPPCSACVDRESICPECGWQGREERMNQHVYQVNSKTQVWEAPKLRELDKTKIDWHYEEHTNFSMIKKGCYPEGTTQKEVEKEVRGTFGGRFEYFGNGKFGYIAYTD